MAARKGFAVMSLFAAAALTLTACGTGNNSGNGSKNSDGDITLTVATFNEFGYSREMFDQYEAEHPGIKVKEKKQLPRMRLETT